MEPVGGRKLDFRRPYQEKLMERGSKKSLNRDSKTGFNQFCCLRLSGTIKRGRVKKNDALEIIGYGSVAKTSVSNMQVSSIKKFD